MQIDDMMMLEVTPTLTLEHVLETLPIRARFVRDHVTFRQASCLRRLLIKPDNEIWCFDDLNDIY